MIQDAEYASHTVGCATHWGRVPGSGGMRWSGKQLGGLVRFIFCANAVVSIATH